MVFLSSLIMISIVSALWPFALDQRSSCAVCLDLKCPFLVICPKSMKYLYFLFKIKMSLPSPLPKISVISVLSGFLPQISVVPVHLPGTKMSFPGHLPQLNKVSLPSVENENIVSQSSAEDQCCICALCLGSKYCILEINLGLMFYLYPKTKMSFPSLLNISVIIALDKSIAPISSYSDPFYC